MGSLTVLAGLMFTLGTRPVSALRVYSRTSAPSPTVKAFEDEKEKLMKIAKDKGLDDRFKNRIESLDDGYKLRALKEEVRLAEEDGYANNGFKVKLVTFEQEMNAKYINNKYKKDIKLGLEYLKRMDDDAYFSTHDKERRLADLEKCLTTPSHIKDIRWFR